VLVGGEPGPWGPAIDGGSRWRVLTRLLIGLGALGLVAATAITTTGLLLVRQAEMNLTRVPVPELTAPVASTGARHFLLVGSDARDGLAAEDRDALSLGNFDGQRSDTIIYVAISEDREHVSLVSLPRDLLVLDGDRPRKLTDTFAGGPDQLVRVISENFGLPVNHYVQISLGGFLDVVRTLDGVTMCLPEALVDPKSGANFPAGCRDFDAAEALSVVRSRRGAYGDYERIARQQMFLRAVLDELVATRVLANPRRLLQLVDDVSSHVTTDETFAVAQMRGLADEMRQVVADGVPMTTVPAYPRRIDGIDFMVVYRPGAEALFGDLRNGQPLAEVGSRAQRGETGVALLSAGRTRGSSIVDATLRFAGFASGNAGQGPASLDPGAVTTVYVVPGEEERAGWVAATLGAPTRPLPASVTVPAGVHVMVAIGEDAVG
jgi:LCP family protein required for cell wall assembly